MPKSLGLGRLKYPLDTHEQVGSKISFTAIQVKPPAADITPEKNSSSTDIMKGGSRNTSAAIKETIGKIASNAASSSQKIIPMSGEKCDLYLPVAYQVNDALQYDHASLGSIGGAVAGVMQSGGGVMSGLGKVIQEGSASIMDFFQNGAFAGQAARIGAVLATQKLGSGIGDAVSITARITVNPNLRTKFNGVSIREFTFQFEFIPRSAQESVVVKNIVKFFRFHAYPEEIPFGRAFPVALDYPNMFKIRLLSQRGGRFENIGTPIKYCYLRTVNTVYNPTTSVLHADGAPTQVNMSLAFTEYKPLTRFDIVNEDDPNAFDTEPSLTDHIRNSLPTEPNFPNTPPPGRTDLPFTVG